MFYSHVSGGYKRIFTHDSISDLQTKLKKFCHHNKKENYNWSKIWSNVTKYKQNAVVYNKKHDYGRIIRQLLKIIGEHFFCFRMFLTYIIKKLHTSLELNVLIFLKLRKNV